MSMKDTQLYSQILGIEKPWRVTDVAVSLVDDEVEVAVEHVGSKPSCAARSAARHAPATTNADVWAAWSFIQSESGAYSTTMIGEGPDFVKF